MYECSNWETEHYCIILFWKLEVTVSFLGTHKWEPDIYIGFSSALHLQCSWPMLFSHINLAGKCLGYTQLYLTHHMVNNINIDLNHIYLASTEYETCFVHSHASHPIRQAYYSPMALPFLALRSLLSPKPSS